MCKATVSPRLTAALIAAAIVLGAGHLFAAVARAGDDAPAVVEPPIHDTATAAARPGSRLRTVSRTRA